jgi:hypothetical protein
MSKTTPHEKRAVYRMRAAKEAHRLGRRVAAPLEGLILPNDTLLPLARERYAVHVSNRVREPFSRAGVTRGGETVSEEALPACGDRNRIEEP